MRWGPLAWLCCVACGRLHFAPRDDAAAIDAAIDAPFATGPFGPAMPIVELDSAGDDDDPSLTADLLEIYFMSNRSGPDSLYRATRNTRDESFAAPTVVTEIMNGGDCNNVEITPDGLAMVFVSTRAPNAGQNDIWIATRADRTSAWGNLRRLDEVATASLDFEPFMVGDRLTLYFSSNRAGNTDYWVATRSDEAQPFGNLASLAELSSSGYDGGIWVDASERFAFFHRDGGGSQDMFSAARTTASEPWSAPQPITELNTSLNDQDPWLSSDGRLLVFASSNGTDFDILMATR